MKNSASDLAHRLAENAEAVCHHYLGSGRREGGYWLVGDARNTPGRSLHVRLKRDGLGRAPGKWTDEATGEHGDLLDIIRESLGLTSFADAAEEARRFLSLPRPPPQEEAPAPQGSPGAARRLLASAGPAHGTLAERYLRSRGLMLSPADLKPLKFHPRCYYWPHRDAPKQALPALIATVTDLGGVVTGAHRTWLKGDTDNGTPVVLDRRAMGALLNHGVRFGAARDLLIAGEGIETTLSLRMALPRAPLIAALSAAHLGALAFPRALKRLYVARDTDAAGDSAFARLSERGADAGVDIVGLHAERDDFNTDLRAFGVDRLGRAIRAQLADADFSVLRGA